MDLPSHGDFGLEGEELQRLIEMQANRAQGLHLDGRKRRYRSESNKPVYPQLMNAGPLDGRVIRTNIDRDR